MLIDTPVRPAPEREDVEALIREARSLQRRRRLIGAAGLLLALGVIASIYAVVNAIHHRANNRTSVIAGPPVCRSSQLATSSSLGAAAGTALVPVVISNVSGGACSLPASRPDVRITFAGRPIAVRERSWSSPVQFGPLAPRLLGSGAKDYIELGFSDFCPQPTEAPTTGTVMIMLRFHGGPIVRVPEQTPEGIPGIPGCGEGPHPAPVLDVSQPLHYG